MYLHLFILKYDGTIGPVQFVNMHNKAVQYCTLMYTINCEPEDISAY